MAFGDVRLPHRLIVADLVAVTLIVAVRGLVPLLLLRWPFWGALACMAGDAFDSAIQDALGSHVLPPWYHDVDKAFDTYYLGFEAWIVHRRWTDPLARTAALALFAVRLGAAVLYEITGVRALFFFGANVFENFYIFARDACRSMRRTASAARALVVILAITGAPKMLQEYVMHYRESQTWEFVKRNILMWR